MATAISPAALKRRGTGNLTMEQINYYLENKDRAEELVATLQKHADDARETEAAALARVEEAGKAEADLSRREGELQTATTALEGAEKVQADTKARDEAAIRRDREMLAAERKAFEQDRDAFTEQHRQKQDALKERERRVQTRDRDANVKDRQAEATETRHETERAALDKRAEEINSAALKIGGIAAQLVKG